MNILSYISEWLETLVQNKMRSFLSLLGIVIGITSVVVLTAIWDGMKADIIKSMVTTQNIIKIERGKVQNMNPWEERRWEWEAPGDSNDAITIEQTVAAERIFHMDTVKLLQDVFSDQVQAVIPVMEFRQSTPLIIDGEQQYADIRVVENTYFSTRDMEMGHGTFFTPFQIEHAEPVAIIGADLVERFWRKNPLGKTISVNNTAFRIVGILKRMDNWESDTMIYIPHTTAKERFGTNKIEHIEVHAKDLATIHTLQKNLWYFLLKYTDAPDPQSLGFHLSTNEGLLKMINEQIGQMTLFISSIAAISLFVGGIGIMNIMLVSVTERTREIGIRKAIGARKKDIIVQFLTESSILSFIGGILAIIFSYLICLLVEKLFPDISTIISIHTIIVATGFSILMGIVFGLLPAWKAAKMDAIEALRFE